MICVRPDLVSGYAGLGLAAPTWATSPDAAAGILPADPEEEEEGWNT
ncbi:MAG TPA: hypothetical protein VJN18_11675 [Polyangiaceae bacterium]|nr:hypothetical protein [Polyangiaceae bacterium]